MEENLILLLLLASGGMLTLVLAVVLFVFIYQRKLLAQKISLQTMENIHQEKLLSISIEMMESERRRIAKDLHDEIGASLTALKIYTGKISDCMGETDQINTINQQSRALIEKTIQNVRTITRDLMPATLEYFGLKAAIQETCELLNQPNIQIALNYQLSIENLSKPIELGLYRIVRELLNNTYKYAEASHIQIDLFCSDDQQEIRLNYQDDGKGFDFQGFAYNDKQLGLGLRSIETRVKALHGTVDLESKLGEGMKVRIRIPNDVKLEMTN